jgi:hypothetical protein
MYRISKLDFFNFLNSVFILSIARPLGFLTRSLFLIKRPPGSIPCSAVGLFSSRQFFNGIYGIFRYLCSMSMLCLCSQICSTTGNIFLLTLILFIKFDEIEILKWHLCIMNNDLFILTTLNK